MTNSTLAVLAAVALLSACSKETRDAESTPPRPERDPAREPSPEPTAKPAGGESPGSERSCGERTDRLAARLAALSEQGAAFSAIPPEITPIESSAGTRIRTSGTALIVGADGGMTLLGERIAGIRALEERLARELAGMRMAGRTRPLHVWADRSVPAARVAAIAAAAPEGLEVRLAFGGPERQLTAHEEELLAVPRVKRSHEELEGAADFSQRAVRFARTMEPTIGLCAPLVAVYGDIAGMPADEKYEYMAARAPKAIGECECDVADLDMLEYLLLWSFGAFHRPARSVPAAEAASVFR